MHRTQLLLDEWQFEALRAQAASSHRSISDLVREIVSAHLAAAARRAQRRVFDVEGVGEGPPDLGGGHDAYLYGTAAAPPGRGRRRNRPA